MKRALMYTLIPMLLGYGTLMAQVHYPDAAVRMHPVWSRVADVYGEMGSVETAEFSPDGRFIISGAKYDNSIILWRTSDGTELWRRYTEQEIERVGWSSDSRWVASCSEDRMVRIWEAATGALFKELPHEQGIDGLAWSHQGLLLVTGEEGEAPTGDGRSGTRAWLRLYQLPEGRQLHRVDFGGTINKVLFSDDDRYLLAAGHQAVKVYRSSDLTLLRELQPEGFFKFTSAGFTPDARYIAASGFGGDIFVWEWQTGTLVRRFDYRGRKVESLAWHPGGEYLVTVGHGPYIDIFRTRDILAREDDEVTVAAQVFANDGAEYIDFNADGGFAVTAHQDGVIRLWVWKGEDPNLNARRHSWITDQQKKARALQENRE